MDLEHFQCNATALLHILYTYGYFATLISLFDLLLCEGAVLSLRDVARTRNKNVKLV